MKYIMEYEISALIFLSVVVYRFFSKRRFPNKQNKLFSIILISAIVDITLDIVGSIAIENALALPAWVNYAINTVFYSIQLTFPVYMFLYILVIVKDLKVNRAAVLTLLIPYCIFQLFVFTNYFHHLIFYVDPELGYVHNIGFYYLYVNAFFYMAVSFALILKYHRQIRRIQYNVVISFIFIISVTMIIQSLLPSYLLTGVAIALAIAMVYFTLQNPADLLDSFTKAFNSEAFQIFLENRITEKNRFQLIVLNVDGMRRINNLFGALAGNEVLQEVSFYLQAIAGKPWVFKLQGTRFAIVTFDREHYQQTLNDIVTRFNRSWNINNMHLVLSAYIRHFDHSSFFKKSDDVLNLIDLAFTREKYNHENVMVKEIEKDLLLKVQRQMAVEKALREGLDKNEGFELYFQPIYAVKTKTFNSMEVLLRFQCPEFGFVSPGEFIPIAERTGLILRIDELVMRRSFEFLNRHNVREDLGISTIEVNLSAAEFINQGFYDRFIQIYEHYRVDPDLVIFEITETAATISCEVMIEYMEILNKFGIKFALDDFGKGYANLTQVVNLPFSIVKLDRSLLVGKYEGEKNGIVFEDIMNMFKRLGMAIVVEGVESLEDVNQVIDLNPNYIQGFYYAKPMPENELIPFLKKANNKFYC